MSDTSVDGTKEHPWALKTPPGTSEYQMYLTWVAAETDRIGLVPNVLGLPYREPPITAKMAESLDRLSRGRLTLGLGAGGNDAAIGALGLVVRTPGEKIRAMEEAIEIIRGLWQEETFTYHGQQFHTEGARLEPKAARPIPIWLGTYGPRALDLTGRLADGWSPSLPFAPFERAREMRDRIRRAAERAGRSPDAVLCNYNLAIHIGGRARDERAVGGTVEEVVERLATFARAGFISLSFWPMGDEEEQVTRLAQEVIPAVRAAVPDAAGVDGGR